MAETTGRDAKGPGKALVTLLEEQVAPRFDLTTDVLLATIDEEGKVASSRTVVLAQASAEDLCHLVVTEGVRTVVCGGIEEEYHQYLTWKRVRVVDSVMGPWSEALSRLAAGTLAPEANLFRDAGGPGPVGVESGERR